MPENLTRAYAGDLHVRSEGDGRTICGTVVPYGVAARVSDGGPSYPEMFEFGSYARSVAERGDRVKLLAHHNTRTMPLGRATLLREDPGRLYGEFRVSATTAGNEALELIRDGALDSFSVGFEPIRQARRGGTVVRTEVRLREVSLVAFGAYEDARVTAVRSGDRYHLTTARDRLALARVTLL